VLEPAQERLYNAAFGRTLLLFFRVVLAGFDPLMGTPMRLSWRCQSGICDRFSDILFLVWFRVVSIPPREGDVAADFRRFKDSVGTVDMAARLLSEDKLVAVSARFYRVPDQAVRCLTGRRKSSWSA
jgi:hypothetical protein